jgi:large subunit ribosomal protein L21
MSYAIVRIAGKQYKVSPKKIIIVDNLDGAKGEKIEIGDVLLLKDEGKTQIGTPNIENFSLRAVILDQIKAKKQKVVKFKPKSRYKKVLGARRFLTKLEIGDFPPRREKIKKKNS